MLLKIDQTGGVVVPERESREAVDRVVNEYPAMSPKRQEIIVGNEYWLATHAGILATIVFRGRTIGFFKLTHGTYPIKAVKNTAQWKDGQTNKLWLILDPAFVHNSLPDKVEKIMEESYWERVELILGRQWSGVRVGLNFLPETMDLEEILVVIHCQENCSSCRITPRK